MNADVLLLIGALVCFVLATFVREEWSPRIHFGWLGLVFWVLSLLV